jgi:hypothetical protein
MRSGVIEPGMSLLNNYAVTTFLQVAPYYFLPPHRCNELVHLKVEGFNVTSESR